MVEVVLVSLLGGGIIGVAAFYIVGINRRLARDASDRRHSEQHEQSRNHVLELLAHGAPLAPVLEAIVRGVERQNPDMLCSISLLDSEGKHLLTGAAPSLPDFFNAALNGLEIGIGAGSCGTAAFTGQRVIVEDIQSHPYWAPYQELSLRAGMLVGADPHRFRQGAWHACHLSP